MKNLTRLALVSLTATATTLSTPLASAHSHEAAGEHVQTFHENLDVYAFDVQKMNAQLDSIATKYAGGSEVQDDIKAFLELWETVEYHEAVEDVTMPLYPPIWVAIGGLQQAVNEKASARVVGQKTDAVKGALHEGMGAIRWAAVLKENGGKAPMGSGHHDDHHDDHHGSHDDDHDDDHKDERPDSQAEIKAIQAALTAALAEYAGGHLNDAKKLVQDAYLYRFEGLEGELIAQDPELVSVLEKEFNIDLPVAMNSGKSQAEVAAIVKRMNGRLDRAADLLKNADSGKSSVF